MSVNNSYSSYPKVDANIPTGYTVTNSYNTYLSNPTFGTNKIALFTDNFLVGYKGVTPPTDGGYVKGYLGIGQASASTELDVAGSIRTTGKVDVSETISTSTALSTTKDSIVDSSMSSLTVTLADAANLDQVKNIRLKSSACFPVVVTCVRGSFNLSNANPTRTLRFTSDGWTTDAPITYDSFYAATQKQLVTSAAESLVRSGFGYSIAISGNGLNAVIGTNVLNFSVGGARIYTRSTVTDTWTYQANVLGTGAASWALQGASCDISYDGNTVIVGGTAADSWAGALWIFTRTGTTWSQLGDKLVGTDAIGAANQGTSIAISADGQYIASGGIEDNSGVGAVWVFKYDGQGYSQYGDKIIGTGSTGAAHQGRSVSLSNDGTYLAFGGDANDASHGATWLYVNLNGSFSEQYEGPMVGTGYINAPHQGYSIKLSAAGNTLVVGGYGDDTNTGAVWIWTRTGSTWTQMGSKLIGTDAVGAAKQGYSVSITSDGNTIAVLGTTNNTNAGAIWRWSRSGDKWIQQGTYLIPSTVITTLSTITMSASGKELILGAMNGGGADYTGQIYYFN